MDEIESTKEKTGRPPLYRWAIGYAIVYLLLQLAGGVLFSPMFWGFNLLHFVPLPWLAIFILGGGMAIALFFAGTLDRLVAPGARWMEQQPVQFLVIVSAIYCSAALLLRVQIPLLGDSFLVVDNYLAALRGSTQLYMVREPGSLFYFFMLGKIAGVTSYQGLQNTFLIGEMILGTGMIILNFAIVRQALQSHQDRFLIFLFLCLLPSMQLFFGYIETYPVEAFCLNLFLFVALLSWNGRASFLWVCLSYSLLVAAHSLMIILAPALIYMAYRVWRSRGVRPVAAGAGVIAVCAIAEYLAVGSDLARIFPSEQYTHYLSIVAVNDGFQPYALFSPYHLLDLLNQIILVAPFGIFLASALARNGRRQVFSDPPLLFLAFSSVLILGFLVVAKFDLGQAADWDVTAPGLMFIQFSLALIFFRTFGRQARAFFPLICLLMVLHTGLWVGLNSTREPAIQRFKSLGESGLLAPYAYQFNAAHLAAYYLNEKDIGSAIGIWRTYNVRYPDSTVGLNNVIALCSQRPEGRDGLMDSSYQKWILIAPRDRDVLSRYIQFCLVDGTRYMRTGENTRASYYFRQAIAYDSTCVPAYPVLARVTSEGGDTVEAIHLLERSLRIDPRYLESYVLLGKMYSSTGRDIEAIDTWNKLLSYDSTSITGYMELASSYKRVGR